MPDVLQDDAFPFRGLHYAGNLELNGLYGAVYTDTDSDQARGGS